MTWCRADCRSATVKIRAEVPSPLRESLDRRFTESSRTQRPVRITRQAAGWSVRVVKIAIGFSPNCDSSSLNRVSKRPRVFANPNVPRHDHDQGRRLTKQLSCGQVHRVKRTNWLAWKRSAHASENRVGHGHYETAPLEATQRA